MTLEEREAATEQLHETKSFISSAVVKHRDTTTFSAERVRPLNSPPAQLRRHPLPDSPPPPQRKKPTPLQVEVGLDAAPVEEEIPREAKVQVDERTSKGSEEKQEPNFMDVNRSSIFVVSGLPPSFDLAASRSYLYAFGEVSLFTPLDHRQFAIRFTSDADAKMAQQMLSRAVIGKKCPERQNHAAA